MLPPWESEALSICKGDTAYGYTSMWLYRHWIWRGLYVSKYIIYRSTSYDFLWVGDDFKSDDNELPDLWGVDRPLIHNCPQYLSHTNDHFDSFFIYWYFSCILVPLERLWISGRRSKIYNVLIKYNNILPIWIFVTWDFTEYLVSSHVCILTYVS